MSIYFKKILAQLGLTFLNLFSKDAWLFKVITALFFFFQGIHLYLLCIVCLTCVDVLSGVYAAMRRGEKFSSRKFRRGLLEKILLYIMLLLGIFFVDTILMSAILTKTFYMSAFITFLIAMYEMSSIAENVHSVRPDIRFLQPLSRLFKKMENKTIGKMEKNADDLIDELTDVKKHLTTESDKTDSNNKTAGIAPITPNGQDITGENPITSP